MIRLLLIRHGVTDWNEQKRIQGHTDVPLSDAAKRLWGRRRLPPDYRSATWVSSPLRRATQTAECLGAVSLRMEDRLTEMHWGEWEGRQLAALRAEFGEAMCENEARGLDFRPLGGESPREVRDRISGWLDECLAAGESLAVVTHKGVIRAALSLATGWDMRDKVPHRLDCDCAHGFR
ncbi:MAG: histidine phosphatase family protein, partial [Gammaproteobacteria bacterium]